MLQAENLTVSYDRTPILRSLNVRLPAGKITALIGPNGCGKSTLLNTLARVIRPQQGEIRLNDIPLSQLRDKQIARRMALLPQQLNSPDGITVRQLVEYGRTPHISRWGRLSATDHVKVEEAMQMTGVHELAERLLSDLSGGQRQRAWIAMTLAQDTDLILLDEPTTYLDLSHQVELLNLMRQLNAQGKTIVVVLHDLNQACRWCDHLVVVKAGEIVCEGAPREVFKPDLLKSVFNLEAQVVTDPVAGTPMCIPV